MARCRLSQDIRVSRRAMNNSTSSGLWSDRLGPFGFRVSAFGVSITHSFSSDLRRSNHAFICCVFSPIPPEASIVEIVPQWKPVKGLSVGLAEINEHLIHTAIRDLIEM